jgi:hypothetical protein
MFEVLWIPLVKEYSLLDDFPSRQNIIKHEHMGMDQYLLIPVLMGWTSIYQLFWCSPGVQGFDTLPYTFNDVI